MAMCGQLLSPAALTLVHIRLETYSSWIVPDVSTKKKIMYRRGSNPGRPVLSLSTILTVLLRLSPPTIHWARRIWWYAASSYSCDSPLSSCNQPWGYNPLDDSNVSTHWLIIANPYINCTSFFVLRICVAWLVMLVLQNRVDYICLELADSTLFQHLSNMASDRLETCVTAAMLPSAPSDGAFCMWQCHGNQEKGVLTPLASKNCRWILHKSAHVCIRRYTLWEDFQIWQDFGSVPCSSLLVQIIHYIILCNRRW